MLVKISWKRWHFAQQIVLVTTEDAPRKRTTKCYMTVMVMTHHRQPKLQLWDDHLTNNSRGKIMSLFGNIYDRSKE